MHFFLRNLSITIRQVVLVPAMPHPPATDEAVRDNTKKCETRLTNQEWPRRGRTHGRINMTYRPNRQWVLVGILATVLISTGISFAQELPPGGPSFSPVDLNE